ncbi:MAG: Ig-like domain-containing protein, partial [Eubacterium sp.]|nr:Ig-like domain-containing protein [Eubacterium sp.]
LADIREEALTKAEQNQTVSLPEKPSVDGYRFAWTGVSADASGKYNVGTADTINVVGVWSKQKYNVSYRFDGMVPSGATVPATKAYEWGDTVRLTAMADQGAYTFAGWTGVTMKTDSTFEMPKNDVTLVGRWIAKSIRINPNGGVWSGSTDESVCDYTENIGDIEKPVMKRFTFKEWSEGAGDSAFAKVLTAKWNTAVAAEDFSYHILKPELTADIAKKLADVAAVGADGDPTDVISVNAEQLADIQTARANKKNGDYPLTFSTNGAEKTITVTLYGAFTVSAQDYSGTYDRQAHSGTVTVSGLEDYSIRYRTEADGAYTLEEEPHYTDAGIYTYYFQVTEEGDETEENQTAEGSVTVSIAPKSLTDDSIVVTVTPDETEYQTGVAITPAVTVKDGDIVLTEGTDYTLSGDQTKTEIGSYMIAVAGMGNYQDSVNAAWEITRTKMKGITVDGYEGSYDGAEHGISITLSGTSEGAAVKYGTSADNCSPGDSPTFTDAGEYVVYYEIAKDGYKTEKGSAKVVIHEAEQAAPDVSATDETIKGKADGSIVGVTPAMEYRREGEEAYKAIAGTRIEDLPSGIYYVRYQAKKNYSASPDKKAEVGSGRSLAVILPGETEQKGYHITADRTVAGWHEKVTLTFALDSGYDPAETRIAVTNGTLAKISDTSYEIIGIEADTEVTVTVRKTIDLDAGNIQKEVMVLPGAPDTVLNNSKAELAEILTPEEKAEVNKGVNAKIWLEVSPVGEIAPSDREKVEKAAEAVVGTGTEVMYFDASLFKRVGDGEQMAVSEPGRPISVTIVIPEEIRNKDVLMVRSYRIIRLHEGKTDVIEGTYNEKTAEFTFESDKFSTYAICYKDTPKKAASTQTPAPGGTKQPGTPVPDENGQTGNRIEKRKDLSILLATGKQKGKNSIRLTWLEWKGASGYEVYWSYCDNKKNYKKLSKVKVSGKRVFVHKKLKKDRAYKYYIAAYKMKDGKKKYIAKSPAVHVAMKYEKRTNVKKITVNKARVTLRPKKKFQIRAKTVKWNKKKKALKHVAALRYYTGNKKVATVSKKGRITAKGKGTCTVYVIANNGVAKKIKVKVK